MADEDVPEEGGPEPAAEEPDEGGTVAVDEAEAPVEAPSFGVDDIAAGLGSVFQERFLAHHEPTEALRLYGEARDHLQSAYGRIAQGGEPTDEDFAAAEALGIDLAPPEEPEVEPLWGAPWAEPTTMDEFNKIAAERPWDALAFADSHPGKINDETRQQVLNYWAEHDRAAAISYEVNHAKQQQEEAFQRMLDERDAKLREELAPVHARNAEQDQANRVTTAKLMVQEARTGIPDFDQHEEGVIALIEEGMRQYGPSYFENILSATPEARLRFLSDLTGAAAWRARPAAQAEAEEAQKAAEAAKVGAGSERGRGGASQPGTSTAQSEMKKKFTEDIRRAVENPA